ncbi:MAG: PduL/EutD family phosphate acyltransferase, partial [Clostridia bacterium]|nr:PduL/EutD family phosphate acyltransferase [Clostridia bacterium]
MDEASIRQIVREVIAGSAKRAPREIAIEASARHVHLTEAALAALFGDAAVLEVRKELSQTGEFLSDKRVKLITPKGEIADVAVLGPLRKAVQVELSATD